MSEALVMTCKSVPPREARLSEFRKGERGIIISIGADTDHDIERRLIELGFIEGGEVEVLHEGTFGRDPIAVKLGNMRLALRRREASNVLVRRLDD